MIYASKLDWIEATAPDENDQLVFEGDQGKPIAVLDIPHGLLRDFITEHAASYPHVHLDGTIKSEIDETATCAGSNIAIDDMIARDVGIDMLEDEPDAQRQLIEFKTRLQRSLALVMAAIERLQLDNTDHPARSEP